MYVETIKNRNSPPAILVRESYWHDGKSKKRTLANLSKLPPSVISVIRAELKNSSSSMPEDFQIIRSVPHGHVAAIIGTLRNLGLDRIIDTRPSRMRELCIAMIAARIIDPRSKLATCRALDTRTMADAIRNLVDDGALQPTLFDERDLGEITCKSLYPGERLVVCRNPLLADKRRHTRDRLLELTETLLDGIVEATRRDKYRLKRQDLIVKRATRALDKHKMSKHFKVEVGPGMFRYTRNLKSIDSEAALDGFYVIRTSVAQSDMSTADVLDSCKRLSKVERAFRSMKTVDLKVLAQSAGCGRIFCCACSPTMSNSR